MKKKIIVLKYGSATISEKDIQLYVKEIKKLKSDWLPVVVSSGSVKLGLALADGEFSSRLLASIGSGELITLWQKYLSAVGIMGAQVLVTHADVSQGGYLLDALHEMLEGGVLPVINENDMLSDTELMKLKTGGDNDGLAAHLATELQADSLVLLSNDVEGYMVNGVIQNCVDIRKIDRSHHFQKTNYGTGGIESKISAAQKALDGGVGCVYYANAKQNYVDILDRKTGSCFCGRCSQN